ncbi:MAG: hypothetical protein U5J78_04660 [Parasphingorhabdus sp.]|nr:hypothetical protein [Parasphingorhabdus sp.]
MVKTLVAAVALNNMACILLFEVARSLAHHDREGLARPPGAARGRPVHAPARARRPRPRRRRRARAGHAERRPVGPAGVQLDDRHRLHRDLQLVDISPLLSCLFLGVALTNLTPDKDEVGHRVFENFEGAVFAVFFTVAGMELDFRAPRLGLGPRRRLRGGARRGKDGGGVFGHGPQRLDRGEQSATSARRSVPQAGVAVGLVLLVADDRRPRTSARCS